MSFAKNKSRTMKKFVRLMDISRQFKHGALLAALLLVSACGPSEEQKAQLAEKKRLECLDKICEGDVPPKVGADEFVMKLNGHYFSAPREYGGYGGTLAFFWPSKTPANRHEVQEKKDKKKACWSGAPMFS